MDESNGSPSPAPPRGKVARLLSTYELDGLGEELERRWTRSDGERASIRDLVHVVNRRLLDRALVQAGQRPAPSELDQLYRTLTDDGVGDAERTRAQRRLEREGVDVESLLDEFVSRQAVHTYLTSDRDLSYDGDSRSEPQAAIDTIGRLRSRLHAVTTDRLERTVADEGIQLSDRSVLVTVRLYCEACGDEFPVGALSDGVRCSCYD